MSSEGAVANGRPYAGRSPDERRQQRRQRLLDAGLRVFGTVGYDEATITLLCATARVGTKAFYEEFPTREALLLAVATDVVATAAVRLEKALKDSPPDLEQRVRAGLTAYIGYLTEDPRRVRIAYREIRVAPLEAERQFASVAFASLVSEQVTELGMSGHAHDNLLLALALTGGVGELLNHWTSALDKPPTERLVEELT
ncbi:MAG: TetR/AcrR family transcriptional regulator, partial [Mycobacteriales bacterium]